MTTYIDSAVARLQALALACTSVSIKSAPNFPVENAEPAPFVVSYIRRGENTGGDSTFFNLIPTVEVIFFFNRSSLADAYAKSDAIALEYNQRLCGDPTLSETVGTIEFPVTFEVGPAEWNKVPFTALTFTIKLNSIKNPV